MTPTDRAAKEGSPSTTAIRGTAGASMHPLLAIAAGTGDVHDLVARAARGPGQHPARGAAGRVPAGRRCRDRVRYAEGARPALTHASGRQSKVIYISVGVVSVCRIYWMLRFSITIFFATKAIITDLIEAIPSKMPQDANPIPYWMDGAPMSAETTCTPSPRILRRTPRRYGSSSGG